jgi:hypothetical protein
MVTAVYLLNRIPTKILVGLRHGWKSVVNHLRVFGCRAYVKELDHINKLAYQSHVGVFIGYTKGAKAYHILDPIALRACTTQPRVRDQQRISPLSTSTLRISSLTLITMLESPSWVTSTASPIVSLPEFMTLLENGDDRLDVQHRESAVSQLDLSSLAKKARS